MTDPVQFLASFPSIQTAIKITGNGDGMRIQLDIPETEMGQAARLILMRECILRITVEVVENEHKQQQTSGKTTY
jgi:hypothetical protein